MKTLSDKRILSIDLLRGVVMVLMALDHVRDYFFHGSFFTDPTNLAVTTAPVFLTRWITHFCAPVFVFLAGISAYLFISKTGKKRKGAQRLFFRGLFLIFLELTIVNFAWTFDFAATFQLLQVLWAIGFSLIFLSFAVFLPGRLIGLSGLLIIFTHNLLDTTVLSGNSLKSIIWYTLHQSSSLLTSNGTLVSFTYPVLPWIGIIFLGYSFGNLFEPGFDQNKRKRILLYTGLGSIALFILFRSLNLWGESALWFKRESILYSIFSFINTTKYPPSLLFTLMTLGPALIFLSITETINDRVTSFFVTFGQVPMFYYIIHLYMIHLLAVGAIVLSGRPWSDMILTAEVFMTASLGNYGFDLYIVYTIWILVVLMLYPLCRKYGKFKRGNKGKWWVSYL